MIFIYIFFLLQIKAGLLTERSKLKIGDPTEFDSFTSAVIDDKAFQRITSYIEHANSSRNLTVIGGGKYDSRWVAYLKY
jgi:1-pyrroline-5-carboxylate dehydrogenase